MQKINCIIMDWAGTAIDFGCFAPLEVFLNIFEESNLTITPRQAREPMGMLKIDHIRAILEMPEVANRFINVHGRDWNEDDVREMYSRFESNLFRSLRDFTDPIPGVVETVDYLRNEGIKVGSTTGYTREMMDVVRPAAAENGYTVDYLSTPDGLPAGRPAAYMIHENMRELGIPDVRQVIKVGDTLSDIREGISAGVWSVGVITGSSELGLSLAEYLEIPPDELSELKGRVRRRMMEAGAFDVLDSISELPSCIDRINNQ